MKHLNFLSKSSSRSCSHNVVTLASTVGSPSIDRQGTMLKHVAFLLLFLFAGFGQMWATPETITLSDFGWSNGTAQTSMTATSATIAMAQNSAGTAPIYYTSDGLRLYGVKNKTTGCSIAFTAKTGITITGITFTHTSTNSGVLSASTGTYSNKVWSGTLTAGNTVTFKTTNTGTVNNNPQVRITQIVITYTAAAASHTLSSTVSPAASGSVELSSTSVTEGSTATATATPAAHYVFTSWSISGTGASLSSTTTNPTTVTMGTANATVTANFTQAPKASITLSEAGTTTTDNTTYYVGDTYTLPTSTSASCGTKVLVGWSTVTVNETNTKPTSNFYEKGAEVTLGASQTFYAVFATASGTPETWTQITALANITAGTYVIVNNGHALPSATTSSAPVYSDDYEVTISNSKITSSITEGITWYFAGTNTAMTITNKDDSYLYATSANNGVRVGSTSDTWSFAANSTAFQMQEATNSRYCAGTSNGDWRSYTSGTSQYYYDGGKVYLFKKSGGTTYSAYSTDCCLPLGSINGSFLVNHF